MGKTRETVGERIARLRNEQGYSRARFYEMTGIAPRTLQNIEIGTVKDPSFLSIVAIAKGLNISLDELADADLHGGDLGKLIRLFARANEGQRASVIAVLEGFVGPDQGETPALGEPKRS